MASGWPTSTSRPSAAPLVPGRDRYHGHSPRVGEHGREVLGQLGYDEAEVDALVADGVLGDPA